MRICQLTITDLNHFVSENRELTKPSLPKALPPKHVLSRAEHLLKSQVLTIWALPYLIIKDYCIVGCCGFKSAPQQGVVEIGYNVAPSARGQGIASQAVHQLCATAFTADEVTTVKALIAPENTASLVVVQKNDFLFTEIEIDEDGEELQSWRLNRKTK